MGPGGGPIIDMNQMFVNGARTFFGRQAEGANSFVTVEKAKTFPTNVEIEYEMPLAGGKFGTLAYSEIPARTPNARLADDRVGYFTTSIKTRRSVGRLPVEPTSTGGTSRRLTRSSAEPAEADRLLHEHTVPVRYRRWVRDAVLEWNKAFEEVGFDNAIVVPPGQGDRAHMEKDPEDARFNFICWTNADMGFAIGPSRAHPKTGEILDADIVMDEGFISGWVDTWNRRVPHEEVESLGTETIEWLATRPQYDPRVILAPKHEQARIARGSPNVTRSSGTPVFAACTVDGRDGQADRRRRPRWSRHQGRVPRLHRRANCARAFEVGFMRMVADLLGLVGPRSMPTEARRSTASPRSSSVPSSRR